MTPLRQRLIDDLRLRNYASPTITAYVNGVARLAAFHNRSPDLLGPDDIRAFQLDLLQRRYSWSHINQMVCALRFFYDITLARTEPFPVIPYGKRPKTLPCVLAPSEVGLLLDAFDFAHRCPHVAVQGLQLVVGDVEASGQLLLALGVVA